jgi:hypothetical protein
MCELLVGTLQTRSSSVARTVHLWFLRVCRDWHRGCGCLLIMVAGDVERSLMRILALSHDFIKEVRSNMRCIRELTAVAVSFMRNIDWVSRHECWMIIQEHHTLMAADIRMMLGPDEFLWSGMQPRRASGVIAVPDRARPTKRQTLVYEYFPKRPKV